MPKGGLFAGEVTQAAPADGASTEKQKGFQWMEWGNLPPNNCNEVWETAILTPDLHVSGSDALGVYDSGLIIGTGDLTDARESIAYSPNDGGYYSGALIALDPVEAYVTDCQGYISVYHNFANLMVGGTSNLTIWNYDTGTGSTALDQTGIDGTANAASSATDSGAADTYAVVKVSPINSTSFDGGPLTACAIIGKDVLATNWCGLRLSTVTQSNHIEVFFNPADGSIAESSSQGTSSFEVIDRGLWWEVYLTYTKESVGGLGQAEFQFKPAYSSDGVSADVTLTGSATFGNLWVVGEYLPIYRAAPTLYSNAGATGSLQLWISLCRIQMENHSDTEGGYYFEWRPFYSHAELTAAGLSEDIKLLTLEGGSNLIYYDYSTQSITSTDGVNTVAVPITLTADTKYRIGVAYGDSKLRIGVDSVWSSEASYKGDFYAPEMVDVDGASSFFIGGKTFAGNKRTVVARINRDSWTTAPSGDAGYEILFTTATALFGGQADVRLQLFASDYTDAERRNKLQAYVRNSGGTIVCDLLTDVDVCDGNDHVIFFSYDGDAGTALLYVDGVSADDSGFTTRTITTGTLSTSGMAVIACAGTFPLISDYGFEGQFGYFGFHDVYLTNPTDFYHPTNGLQELDEVTWTEWGTQPAIWNQSGMPDTTGYGKNKGSYATVNADGALSLNNRYADDFEICFEPIAQNYWRELRRYGVSYDNAVTELINLMAG